MPNTPAMDYLETPRLVLRPRRVSESAIYHRLWTERDPRVPAHRRIDAHGHPTEADITADLRESAGDARPGLLAVERKDTAAVIGYCGLVFTDKGAPDEPELAFELLRAVHNQGYATEAGRAVVEWAQLAGYPRLWASVWDWNVASRRVLEKLGFQDSGQINPGTEHGRTILTVKQLAVPMPAPGSRSF